MIVHAWVGVWKNELKGLILNCQICYTMQVKKLTLQVIGNTRESTYFYA